MYRSFQSLVLLLCSAVPGVNAGSLTEKASAADAKHESFVAGSDGSRFLPAELRFVDKLGAPDISVMAAPSVGVIGDFATQLKEAGIALVVVPVPPKALLQSGSLGIAADELQTMRAGWEKILSEISAHGVQIIDLLADFLSAKEPMFCLRDTHWSGHGIEMAVTRLVPFLQSAGFALNIESPAEPWTETQIHGDLGGEMEKVRLRFPKAAASAPSRSPLLLLGDSHVLVFHEGGEMHTSGAGLAEQLAVIVGVMPDVMGVRGSGATSSRLQLARHVRAKTDYLKSKKIIVWVFAGREFTEADMWKKIPVIPRKQQSLED